MRAHQLGQGLAELRVRAGKGQAHTARFLGVSAPRVSRMETGSQPPIPDVVAKLCGFYGATRQQTAVLVQFAEDSRKPGWWSKEVPEWFAEYVGLEMGARLVETFESGYIPGLAQTRAYTDALAHSFGAAVPSDNGDGLVAVRTRRQLRLTARDPLVLHAVIDEAALRREVGGRDVMREQVRHLRALAERPNVTIQVLPFTLGAHPGMTGPFTVLRFPEPALDLVYVEIRGGAIYRESAEDVARHGADFALLARQALDLEATTAWLAELEREM